MRIHFLMAKDLLAGGGIETYTREVGPRLAARGHEVTVYSTRGEGQALASWRGMRIVWLPKVKPYWAEKFCGAAMATYKEFMTDSSDIIHMHSVAAGTMAALLRWRSAPCVIQMHGVEWMRGRWGATARATLKMMERTTLLCGDAFTAVSKTQCDYYGRCYHKYFEYIPTAADLKPYASPQLILDLGMRPREYMLFAARLVPEKGLHHLISAFRRVPAECSLVIAGDCPNGGGYERRLHELAGADPRIRFVGRVSGRLLEELYSNARFFIQPSELEGMSICLLEAMSYGNTCIASDIPENLECLGEAGLYFRSKDPEDLARVLDWSLRNPEAARELGGKARNRVEAYFSWDRVVDQLESLYERVVSGNQRKTLFAAPNHSTVASTGRGRSTES
jgi:glycosyltransferase involved in cell wall biosynthesis